MRAGPSALRRIVNAGKVEQEAVGTAGGRCPAVLTPPNGQFGRLDV
jgi:hypothetical protein